ncbi:MAG: GIY-YIG nuclease family protein [Candidatus Tenebribacter davisii]|jgi:putative endonuclease|nr:GIY-YIG nuclease family protein [Candidatus Tenebribacter davisii]
MPKTYWVYILKCSDGSYYTGSTSDIWKRLSEHQSGLVKGYTSKRLPVELVFSEFFNKVYYAISAERKIKAWTRAKKEALINGDFDLLHELSECQDEIHYNNFDINQT